MQDDEHCRILNWQEMECDHFSDEKQNLHWNTCDDAAPHEQPSSLDHFTLTWDIFFFFLTFVFCHFGSYWCPRNPLLWSCSGDSTVRLGRPLLFEKAAAWCLKSCSWTDRSHAYTPPFLSPFLLCLAPFLPCKMYRWQNEATKDSKIEKKITDPFKNCKKRKSMIAEKKLNAEKWNSDECDIYFIDLFLGGNMSICVQKYVCLIFNLRFQWTK